MVSRARFSVGIVRPTKPVRSFGALFTLGRSRRWRLEFTHDGVREVCTRGERWTRWADVRAAYIGTSDHRGLVYCSWLALILYQDSARGVVHRRFVPLAVSQSVAKELIAPEMDRFASDVRFATSPPGEESFYWARETLPDVENALRSVRVAFHRPWKFKVHGRADGDSIVWCAEAHHANDNTRNDSGPERTDLATAIDDAIEMARRLIS